MGDKIRWVLLALFCWMNIPWVSSAGENDATTLVVPTFQHTWGIRKATPTHLFMFVGWRTTFDDPQGLAAVRLLAWEDTSTEDDDDELVVYGVNSGQHNIIWNTSMYSIGVYGEEGSEEGQFRFPQGIAADEIGNVWVADTGNHRVVRLFNPGNRLIWKGAIGTQGSGSGQFQSPSGVAVDSRGRLYVTDTGNSRIQVFDNSGQHLGNIEADLSQPRGIAIIDAGERWSYRRDTFLCVTDQGGCRLVKLSAQGEVLRQVSEKQTDLESARFGYVAIDYYGNIWVTDGKNHCLHKFDRDMNFVVSFGREGTGQGEFRSPRGLAIWKRYGQVFVAEEAGAQYYWVGVDLLDVQVRPDSSAKTFKISFLLTERAFVTIQIHDEQNRLMGFLMADKQNSIGRCEVLWDGQRPGGGALAAGWYTVRITAEPTYSSYHYFQKIVEKRVKL